MCQILQQHTVELFEMCQILQRHTVELFEMCQILQRHTVELFEMCQILQRHTVELFRPRRFATLTRRKIRLWFFSKSRTGGDVEVRLPS
jgi:hypothetical protein